ncbi:hypothetical protein ACLHDD_05170 [Pantoea sp. NSTU24]|uniref:hypothetical protein n=1 Tax=Pantoea sp. NSTU24 TaxID=3391144 RepID=UPI003D06C18A
MALKPAIRADSIESNYIDVNLTGGNPLRTVSAACIAASIPVTFQPFTQRVLRR